MAEITAALVKELRDALGISMMQCKNALVEAEGDLEQATRILRERGVAVAAKKADRVANQGRIASSTSEDGNVVSLVEINCETDFVARNEDFVAFVDELAVKACTTDGDLAEEVKEEVIAKITELGENLVVRKSARLTKQGHGVIASYIHMGGKVGVLLDVSCEKAATEEAEAFKALAHDLTLHIAACSPRYLTPSDVPAADIEAEKAIYAKQVEGKPAQIIEKIVNGKLQKFFAEICLVKQGFVKDPKQSVEQLMAEVGKNVDDTLGVRRYVRYQIGE
jgi:elongation factor Ts